MMPSFAVHEPGGIAFQPSSVLPSKMRVIPGGSATSGGGSVATSLGAVVGAADGAVVGAGDCLASVQSSLPARPHASSATISNEDRIVDVPFREMKTGRSFSRSGRLVLPC